MKTRRRGTSGPSPSCSGKRVRLIPKREDFRVVSLGNNLSVFVEKKGQRKRLSQDRDKNAEEERPADEAFAPAAPLLQPKTEPEEQDSK